MESTCDWFISSSSSTGPPVMSAFTPGTSSLVSASNSRIRAIARPSCPGSRGRSDNRKIRPSAKVRYTCWSASCPPPNNAFTPGDGGVPGRRSESDAWVTIRSNAGSAPTSDSFSGFAWVERPALRNWRFINWNSEFRLVVAATRARKGRYSTSFPWSSSSVGSSRNNSAFGPSMARSLR
jgi:hypothetical protein